MVNADKAAQRKKERRGVFLTIVLLFQLFLTISIYYLGFFIFSGNPFGVFISVFQYSWPENLVPIFETIFGFCILFTLPLLWKWNKIGVYGLILAALAFIGSTYFEVFDFVRVIFDPVSNSIRFVAFLWCVTPLLIGFMYFWAIKRKWHLFS